MSFEAFGGAAAGADVTPIASDGVPAPPAPRRSKRRPSCWSTMCTCRRSSLALVRPALKNLLTTVAGRSDLLALVAPASSVTIAGELPAPAAARRRASIASSATDVDDQPSAAGARRGSDRDPARRSAGAGARRAALRAAEPDDDADQAEQVVDRAIGRRELHGAHAPRDDLRDGDAGADLAERQAGAAQRGPRLRRLGEGSARIAAYNALVTRSLPRQRADPFRRRARPCPAAARSRASSTASRWTEQPTKDRPAAPTPSKARSIWPTTPAALIVENTNDFEKGLARMLDTMQTYYVIGYEAPPHAQAGFHKIQVEVKDERRQRPRPPRLLRRREGSR